MTEPEQVLHNYREALRKLYGDEIADKSLLFYANGWYYVSVAQRFPDKSCGAFSIADGKRKRQIIEMTENLLRRIKDDRIARQVLAKAKGS